MSDSKGSVAVTLSFGFLWNVRRLLLAAIDDFKPDNVLTQILTQGPNWYTLHAPAAYILAATSIEAFVNEHFFGMAKLLGPKYPVTELGLEEELGRLDLRTKVTLLPTVAGMKSLPRGEAPYQDMVILVKLRNDLVHYKMGMQIPSYVRDLQQRQIALQRSPSSLFAWTDAVSAIEGIRWAHNTALAVISKLAAELPHGLNRLVASVDPIPATWISEQLVSRRGIELTKKGDGPE